ncbi:integrase, catalytic region, zinc finger, CCHC-type containing protein [Tanacetum coccineum]
MLDKDLYDSWKSKMELYMQNREHGRMMLESVEHGPLIWPTIEENGVTRTKKYEELSAIEKIQADCDIKETNIILQGLPSNVYSLVNHHRVAKDLWERIQLLMQGTSLTKQERECKLYDAFDKFAHITEESLHQYYLRLTQLINDINIYKMKLEQFQIDSGLAVPVFKQGDDPIDAINKMMSFLSIVVTSHFQSTNNQLRNSSNPRQQATIDDGRNNSGQQRVVKCFNFQREGHMARQCPEPKRKRDATWFKDKVPLVEAQGSAYQVDDLDAYDSECDDFSTAKAVLMANLSSYGSDVLFEDTNSSTQQDAMILSVFEQQSNQVTNCNKVNKDNLIVNESLSAELERYKERVKLLKERQNLKLSQSAQTVHMLTKPQVFYDNNLKQALGFQNPFYLKKAQMIRPMLYDGSVIAKETNVISIADSKETLMLEEESRSKMLLKQSDPMVLEKKVNIKPINYAELNRLSKDFGKRFVPQQKLSDEQTLWLQTSHPNTDQSASLPVKIKAPRELPKKGNGDMNTSVNVHSFVAMNDSVNYVEMCNKCLELEAELIKQHNMVEKDEYNRLSKSFFKLEQHCISLELAMQLNKEFFQKNNTSVNQIEPFMTSNNVYFIASFIL